MKNPRFIFPSLALALVIGACNRKPDVKQTFSALEKAFPTAAVNGPAAEPSGTSVPQPPATADANAYVSAALSAARSQDYAAGVMALEEVQRMKDAKTVTANQLITIEQAKQAMIADLVARADRGDPKAKADLAAIEKMHSQ